MAAIPHERTKIGRRYLRMARDVRQWIEDYRWCAAPQAILAAENLVCHLNSAAWNSYPGCLIPLLAGIAEMDKHKGAQATSHAQAPQSQLAEIIADNTDALLLVAMPAAT